MADEYVLFADAEGRVFRVGPKPRLDEWRYDMERKVWRLLARDDDDDYWWGALSRAITEGEVRPLTGPGLDEFGTDEGPPWPKPT